MITVGIICEYNPFHNGHLYQIETVKKEFGANCAIIAIMSGNFVQRGEPAVLDKWSRTRAALQGGVNLVIELPAVYATGSAERFADGGVALAAACGLCDYLVFGSESGDLESLDAIAGILAFEPPAYQQSLKACLDLGLSFPASRAKALQDADPSLQAGLLLGTSNNILAVEYLKAIKRRDIHAMKPFAVKREGQGYRETSWDSIPESAAEPESKEAVESGAEFSRVAAPGPANPCRSASAIRAVVASAVVLPGARSSDSAAHSPPVSFLAPSPAAVLLPALVDAMPAASLAILADKCHREECIPSPEVLAHLVFPLLRALSLEHLSSVPGMQEGLGARLKEFARKSPDAVFSFSALVDYGATKRHPRTRVQRALLHMALGVSNADLERFDNEKGPFYLRVLGFDKKGRYLLKQMKTTATLPILMKGSDFLEYANNEENRALRRMAELDCIATDLWMQQIGKGPGQDFTTAPVGIPGSSKPSVQG